MWFVHCIDIDKIQRITENVKARYRRKGLKSSSDTWPPFCLHSFTNLALIHQKITQLQPKEMTEKVARVRTTGAIHEIPELTLSIKLDNIHQIFTQITSNEQTQCPMSILIEGHPGIGKTTLVKQICLQWANNELLTSDKLVLLLMLRDPEVQKITTIEQLVRYTQSPDHVQSVLSYLHKYNGVGVTVIFDGFDELSAKLRQTSFFRNLIEGDILHSATIVVTSRPSASASLHQSVDKRMEILGFEKSSREQCMCNALKDSPDLLTKLNEHFKQYPNIDALCYIPLSMVIVVYLCLLGFFPPTATKMYEMFILHTICHHLKKAGKIPSNTRITQLESLQQPLVCKALKELRCVAFDGLVNDKIVFTVEELPALCKDDPTCYGLLQSTECYSVEELGNPTQTFNFLHLGIQEYFAAKHVTTLPEDEVYTLLKESFIVDRPYPNSKSGRLSNMWILYCGITSGQCNTLRCYLTTCGNQYQQQESHNLSMQNPELPTERYFTTTTNMELVNKNVMTVNKLLSGPFQQGLNHGNTGTISQSIMKNPVNVLYLFQCFQEAQDDILCESLINSFDNSVIDISCNNLHPHQVVSLGFFLSRSCRQWDVLMLSQCHIEDHSINILHQYLCGNPKERLKVRDIILDSNRFTRASSHLISDIINHLHPCYVDLTHNNIDVKVISDAVINTKVKVLIMECNGITTQESTAVADMIVCLKELHINENKIGDHGAEMLSKAIMKPNILQVLAICKNSIGPTGIIAIANATKGNSSLEELYMALNTIGQDGAKAIVSTITNNEILKTLSLGDDTLDEESSMMIIESLHCNNTVTKLFLPDAVQSDSLNEEVIKINNRRDKCNEQKLELMHSFYCRTGLPRKMKRSELLELYREVYGVQVLGT